MITCLGAKSWRLLYTTLLPECSASDGYACRNPGPVMKQTQKKGERTAVQLAEPWWCLSTCPSSSPGCRIRGPSPSPAWTLLLASISGLAVDLTPAITSCLQDPLHTHTHTHTDTHAHTLTLTLHLPLVSLWSPFSPFLPLLVDWVWDWTCSILCLVDSANASQVESP